MGDKWGTNRNQEQNGRLGVGCRNKHAALQSTESKLGQRVKKGTKEKIVKSRGPEFSEEAGGQWETTGRQVQKHAAQSTQSKLGNKWETSGAKPEIRIKSCGREPPKQTGSQLERSAKLRGPKHQEHRNASPGTKERSCSPGTQPFQGSIRAPTRKPVSRIQCESNLF